MYGNIKVLRAGSFESVEESIGLSEVRARIVSAATMPPIECPIKTVRTEGSTVGEGVLFVTSMSITFSWSLYHTVSSCAGGWN